MLRERDALAQADLTCVRAVRMGSAPVNDTLAHQIRALLPKARIINAYGTTEAGMIVFGPHPKGLPQPEASVGARHPKIELRLVDGSNRDADEGVLEMKAPAIMNGYHNRPDVPSPVTPDGYYNTGDVFRRDRAGFYYFIGRTDDMFVSGGENIYPADVERMLERHPGVGQAVVIPVDDDIKGNKPVAFVIPKAGQHPSEDDIKQFALKNAPAYQHPRFVWFVDDLPLASTNKVDRAALKKIAQEKVGGGA
jgi:acyl-CoA synthetase (AMP-forming)/AMP-acid ligase II